jgi:hypothetical protein
VTWRIDQVDQETVVFVSWFFDQRFVASFHLEVHGDSGGLDGNGSFLFILSGVGESHFSGFGAGDNTGFGYQGVGEGGFTVVNVGDDGHVTDVPFLVHDPTDLIYCEVRHDRVCLAQ